MSGVYVHLPFCPYICPYCDFAKWPYRRSSAQRYLTALHSEIDAYADAGEFASVFFGGGTPNTYDAGEIAQLAGHIDRTFGGPSDREVTIEVNPELVNVEDLREYVRAGINRVSIGVQSFVPAEIAGLVRRHSGDQVRDAVEAARTAGVRSISIDLIFAVPGQTPQTWHQSLQSAIALGVDHISTYGLTVESGTPYERWQEREPAAFFGQDAEAELYDEALAELEQAGFEQYEISNFARPGHQSAHNANYWANGEYVGLGVGAASYLGGVRSVHSKNLDDYVNAALEGRPIPGEREKLEGAQRAGEAVMLALRTSQGVPLRDFNERYGIDFLDFYSDVVHTYEREGLLERTPTHVRLTRRGRFLANDVCAAFVTFE